jgi:hypothetical protein
MPKGWRFLVSTQRIGDVPGDRQYQLCDVAIADDTQALLLQLLEGARIERVEPMPDSVDIKEGDIQCGRSP